MSYPDLKPANVTAGDGSDLFGFHKKMYDATRPESRRPIVGSWLMLPGANLARMTASMGFDVRTPSLRLLLLLIPLNHASFHY